ncbi:MAG: hypothetical protein WBD27_05240 [Pyrinomonadaceae bacterium]
MKNLFILITVICAGVLPIAAQKSASKADKREITEMRKELVRDMRSDASRGSDTTALAVSVTDVGEVDSFDKNVKFMGIASSGVIYVYSSCDPAILLSDLGVTLGADDRCLAASNPAVTTSAIFEDVARINLPARANSNIVYMINNHSINWQFENTSVGNVSGAMSYSPRITIESIALNDPAAINPDTGLPMNGSYTTTGNGTKSITQTLVQGEFDNFLDSYSRANTTGLSRSFFAALGLPNSVINELYKKPMTIRLGARLSVRNVPFGQYVYTARFLGN